MHPLFHYLPCSFEMAINVCNWRFVLRQKLITWIQYYNFICPAAAFISSLMTCYHLANLVVVGVLTTYIANPSNTQDNVKRPHLLLIAATLDQVHGGLTAIFEVILNFISDSHISGFKTLLFSSASYVAGLTMLVFWKGTTNSGGLVLITIAIVCLAIGCGGKETLIEFLSEQLRAEESTRQSIDEDQVMARTKAWNRATSIIAAVVGLFLFRDFDWREIFIYLASAMAFSYLVFIFGIRFYHRKEATNRRHDLETSTGTTEITSSFGQTMQECKSESFIRFFFPICGLSIMLGIGISTADTFFQEQAGDLKFPYDITALLVLKGISARGFSFLYDYILSKCQTADTEIMKIRKIVIRWIKVWIGMLLMVGSLLVGWRVEAYRHTSEYEGKIPHLSLWLSLQFLLFGPAETFAEDGLNDLLDEHLGVPMKKYGPSLNKLTIGGLGNISSIILLQGLRHWFPYDLESSRLDEYYLLVAILNFINFSSSILWRFYTVKGESAAVKPLVCSNPPTAEEEAT